MAGLCDLAQEENAHLTTLHINHQHAVLVFKARTLFVPNFQTL